MDINKFIETYKDYYFIVSPEKKKKGVEELGISIIHPTKIEDENEIVSYLNAGEQNIKTIAWKMGASISEDGLKTQYYEFSKSEIDEFCDKAKNISIPIKEKKELTCEDLRTSYNALLNLVKDSDLVGYGAVYIISSMYFLSKGNVPIYDKFVHIAVKALLYDICPQDVFVGQAPGKDEHAKGNPNNKIAVNMLLEYMRLLTDLAKGTEHYKKDGYISRELDQALWVYGHSTKKYEERI